MVELTYRDPVATDAAALHAIASDWAVVRQLGGWPWPPSHAFTVSRCKSFAGDGFVWAVCEQDCLVGSVGVTGGVLGYMFHPDVHGRGIATQAATAAVTQAFATTDLQFIRATTWHDNPASFRVLQKLGFVHWQTAYVPALARRRPTLAQQHRLSRAAWLEAQAQPA